MPTQLIKKYIEEFAKWLRNQQDYCDWTVGMEPIPRDKTWVKVNSTFSSNPEKLDEGESSKPSLDPNL